MRRSYRKLKELDDKMEMKLRETAKLRGLTLSEMKHECLSVGYDELKRLGLI